MTAKSEILMTGDTHTGKFTKTDVSLELNLRTNAEKGTEENEISNGLAKKLHGYGFVKLDLPMGSVPKN